MPARTVVMDLPLKKILMQRLNQAVPLTIHGILLGCGQGFTTQAAAVAAKAVVVTPVRSVDLNYSVNLYQKADPLSYPVVPEISIPQ